MRYAGCQGMATLGLSGVRTAKLNARPGLRAAWKRSAIDLRGRPPGVLDNN